MNRTDTLELPRIVATGSAPLTPARRSPWPAVVALLLLVGLTLAVAAAGHALAWQQAPEQLVEQQRLELELPVVPEPVAAELTGTDAGMITEPAPPPVVEVAPAPSSRSPRSTSTAPAAVAPVAEPVPVVVEQGPVAPVVVDPAPPVVEQGPGETDGRQIDCPDGSVGVMYGGVVECPAVEGEVAP